MDRIPLPTDLPATPAAIRQQWIVSHDEFVLEVEAEEGTDSPDAIETRALLDAARRGLGTPEVRVSCKSLGGSGRTKAGYITSGLVLDGRYIPGHDAVHYGPVRGDGRSQPHEVIRRALSPRLVVDPAVPIRWETTGRA
ncbi:hypothetical protein [Streptomyces jumonjinensis]|uniref:hypothetical protein n=1 Tax=Streptomyces jumonjinensis TaxID=1945 RepID=UPI00379CBACF